MGRLYTTYMRFSKITNSQTSLKKKQFLALILSGIINFLIGVLSVIGLAMSYSFFTEAEKGIDYTGWGGGSLVIILAMILVPNVIMNNKFPGSKKFVLFQFLTLVLGAVVYITIKLL